MAEITVYAHWKTRPNFYVRLWIARLFPRLAHILFSDKYLNNIENFGKIWWTQNGHKMDIKP